jgi:biopolymer transport protein ExbD
MGMIATDTKAGRRGVDSEINLIPMIDLLVVTISFLLLTQCLSSTGRLDASSQIAGPHEEMPLGTPRKLVVDARKADTFLLTWKEGDNIVHATEIAKHEITRQDGQVKHVTYPELSKAIADEWRVYGQHRDPKDVHTDMLVLRTTNELPYASLVGLLDAGSSVRRATSRGGPPPSAFDVTFAVD